jgi:hypothetical protein
MMRLDGLLELLDCRIISTRHPKCGCIFRYRRVLYDRRGEAGRVAHIRAKRSHLKVSFYGNILTFGAVINRTCRYAADAAVVGCVARRAKMSARQRQAIDRILNAGAVFHEIGKRHGIGGQQTVFPHRCIVIFQRHQRSAFRD